MKKNKNNIFINLAVFICSMVILFLLFEIFLRIFYPQPLTPAFLPAQDRNTFAEYDSLLGWKLKPNASGTFFSNEFSVDIKNNEQGLRMDYIVPYEKQKKYRIAFLGDSLIWGFGVNNSERISEVLEKDLNDTEVINFGVSGYGTDQEYLQLDRVLEFNPDMVIIGFSWNDFADSGENIRYSYPKPLFKIVNDSLELTNVPVPKQKVNEATFFGKTAYVLRHISQAFSFFWTRWENFYYYTLNKQFLNGSDELEVLMANYTPKYQQYQQLDEMLFCKISEKLKQKNITFVVVNIPSPVEIIPERFINDKFGNKFLESQLDFDKKSRIIDEFSKNCDFYLIDLYPEFKSYENKTDLYFKTDRHWSSHGIKYAGEIIANNLTTDNIIK